MITKVKPAKEKSTGMASDKANVVPVKKSLKYIFEPKSVAVIGASITPDTVGNAIFLNILQSQFHGAVYPVNPKYNSINSVRAYKDVLSIPDPVEMAVVCVPSTV